PAECACRKRRQGDLRRTILEVEAAYVRVGSAHRFDEGERTRTINRQAGKNGGLKPTPQPTLRAVHPFQDALDAGTRLGAQQAAALAAQRAAVAARDRLAHLE